MHILYSNRYIFSRLFWTPCCKLDIWRGKNESDADGLQGAHRFCEMHKVQSWKELWKDSRKEVHLQIHRLWANQRHLHHCLQQVNLFYGLTPHLVVIFKASACIAKNDSKFLPQFLLDSSPLMHIKKIIEICFFSALCQQRWPSNCIQLSQRSAVPHTKWPVERCSEGRNQWKVQDPDSKIGWISHLCWLVWNFIEPFESNSLFFQSPLTDYIESVSLRMALRGHC